LPGTVHPGFPALHPRSIAGAFGLRLNPRAMNAQNLRLPLVLAVIGLFAFLPRAKAQG
jgi:hypothetical protein